MQDHSIAALTLDAGCAAPSVRGKRSHPHSYHGGPATGLHPADRDTRAVRRAERIQAR